MSDEALSRTKAIRPDAARVCTMRVVGTESVSSSFQRVTLAGADATFDEDFVYMGFDQWFRLFLPTASQTGLALPTGDAEGWYTRWLAMDDDARPLVRNYTIRDARRGDSGWQIDVDFVVHRSPETGEVEGSAAGWALAARPGDTVGILDQGTIFNTSGSVGDILVIADETGLPAAQGIARSLPEGSRATFALEVPHADDRSPLVSDADITTVWIEREDSAALPGRAALAALHGMELESTGYVYAVGEASFVLDARSHARSAGIPKSQVDFCAYWRPERRKRAA